MRVSIFKQTVFAVLLSVRAYAVEPASNVADADAKFYGRALEVLKLYEGEIGTSGYINSTWGNSDEMGDASKALRRIAAGLKLLELHETRVVPTNFPTQVESWVAANVVRLNGVGTNSDYDFVLVQIISLMYHFKDRPDLLTNNAIWSLMYQAYPPAAPAVYFDGQSTTENMVYSGSPNVPETENHVMMAYVWKYLINQWISRNYRSDSRVAAIFDPQKHINGPALEDLMLRLVGRITRCDYFETNARAYQGFTFHALLTLYSNAESPKLKAACLNAINFTVAKYAFQSFEGMRYTVQRRNWTYRDDLEVFDNDYLPTMIGALAGDYRTDTRLIGNYQHQGYALWAILNNYRIPPILHDFILNKDNHSPGFAFWAKMQARFTSVDYPLGGAARYWPNSNVNGHVIHAIEMHYGNKYLMNNTGGDWMPYFPYPASVGVFPFYWKAFENARNYDIYTKPNTVLVKGLENLTLLNNLIIYYDPKYGTVTPSNCNGVYKTFAFGRYATGISPDLASVWKSDYQITNPHSVTTLHFYSINTPVSGYYLVTGEVKYGGTNIYGFYEMIPASSFSDINAFVNRVVANNRYLGEDVTGKGSFPNLPKYCLAVSGEVVVPNPYYLTGSDGDAFIEIYPYDGTVLWSLDDYTFNGSVEAIVSKQPLLEVYQLDQSDRFTGTKYIDNSTEGVLAIYNPYLNQRMVIDARDYNTPILSGSFSASLLPNRLRAKNLTPIYTLLLGG